MLCLCTVALLALPLARAVAAAEVLVFRGDFSAHVPAQPDFATEALAASAIDFREFSAGELNEKLNACSGGGRILLLTRAGSFPNDAVMALRDFLRRGNHLIALSGPPLSELMQRCDEGWAKAVSPAVPPLVLESIVPAYKLHLARGAALRGDGEAKSFPFDGEVIAPLPRSPGFGCDSLRKWRQIPVGHLLDQQGRPTALAAHLFLNNDAEYAGSVWGYIGLSPADLHQTKAWSAPLLISMVRRLEAGVFLANAGTHDFAILHNEPVRLGAYVTTLGGNGGEIEVRFEVSGPVGVVHASARKLRLPVGRMPPQFVPGESLNLPAGEYEISTLLTLGGKSVDRITQPFRVVDLASPNSDETVTVQDGDFFSSGLKWYPLGMNYWPHYMVGLEPGDFSDAQWDRANYDPRIVEADLALAESLGLTVISTQYNRVDQAGPLMDLLARARAHHLKVHLFIPGLDPLQPDFPRASALIQKAHLANSPTLFAYDLGWEVRVGPRSRRASADGRWHAWVVDQYGSIENALAEWDYQPETNPQTMTIVGASDEQLLRDGPWGRYVAAYRRFWDDTISRGYREVREFIHTLDSHHLIGARSGYGGTGGEWIADHFPFDLASGAKHLDFISPEHYEAPKDRLEFLRSAFTTAYARLVSGGKPVYWAEYGKPVAWKREWSDYTLAADDSALREQADYFRSVIEMVHESGANGCAGWWWPAGYRVDEKSDFGIVEPDLSLRPAALALAEAARWFAQPRAPQIRRGEIVIDRDRYATGYGGVYRTFSGDYARQLAANGVPELRTAGTGTDSSNVSLIAVGGAACNGRNPPKFLNAEFNSIRINGQRVRDGAVVFVQAGDSVFVEASVGNTAEAKWLSRSQDEVGRVQLSARHEGQQSLGAIEADTPSLHDAEVRRFELIQRVDHQLTVTFRMTAMGGADFGEVLRVTLRPADLAQPSSLREQPPVSASPR